MNILVKTPTKPSEKHQPKKQPENQSPRIFHQKYQNPRKIIRKATLFQFLGFNQKPSFSGSPFYQGSCWKNVKPSSNDAPSF